MRGVCFLLLIGACLSSAPILAQNTDNAAEPPSGATAPPPSSAAPTPSDSSAPSSASAPAAPAAKPDERTPAPAAPATVLQKEDIQGVLGKDVRSTAGENMGRIVDVIVDKNGHARAAVVDFGGFLGVGSRKIAVSWAALQFTPTEKPNQVTLALTKEQLRAAPEYKEGQPAVVLGASGASEPFEPTSN